MHEKPDEKPSLEALTAQLEALKKTLPVARHASPTSDAARGAVDFASASAVGSVIGFGVDYTLHTAPWGLIAGLIIGAAAGFRMMLRITLRDVPKNPVAPDATTTKE